MRRTWQVAGGALALGALLAWWALRPSSARAPREPEAARESVGSTEGPASSPAPASPVPVVVQRSPALPPGARGAPSLALLQQSFSDYLAVSAYPPWSRAHSAGTADKLTWNRPIADPLPWDDRPGEDVTYRFDADKANVPFGETLTSWIEVVRGGSRPERLPATVREAWVVSNSGPSPGRAFALAYNDEGRDGDLVAGDHVYTNRFVPSAIPALKTSAQSVQIRAVLEANGATPRPVLRDFSYAPRKDIEILAGEEALEDGMLVVRLDVDVHQAGVYTFEANVAGGEEPIAYTETSSTLPLGKQRAALKFFGRAFAEKKVNGPYVVKDIRCFHRFINGEEESFYATYDPAITTRPYAFTQFSGEEWSDPEREQRIANMSRLIEQTKSGAIGQPTGSAPPH